MRQRAQSLAAFGLLMLLLLASLVSRKVREALEPGGGWYE